MSVAPTTVSSAVGLSVMVYTTPGCLQCEATKRWLKKNAINYIAVDVSTDSEALDRLRAHGYTQAPVVQVIDKTGHITDCFTGFRPDLLKALTAGTPGK